MPGAGDRAARCRAAAVLVGNPSGQPRQAGLKFFAPGPLPDSPEKRGQNYFLPGTRTKIAQTRVVRCRPPAAALRLLAAGPSRGRLPGEPVADYHALRPLRFALDARLPAGARIPAQTHRPSRLPVLPCQSGHVGEAGPRGAGPFRLSSIDDDGETCRLWDEQGRPVPPETLLLLLARHSVRPADQRPAAPWSSRQGTSRGAGREASHRWAAGRSLPIRLGGHGGGRCASTMPFSAAVPADAIGTPSARCRARRAEALTLLLVLLSRDDRPSPRSSTRGPAG